LGGIYCVGVSWLKCLYLMWMCWCGWW